jgi:UPF0755 protein
LDKHIGGFIVEHDEKNPGGGIGEETQVLPEKVVEETTAGGDEPAAEGVVPMAGGEEPAAEAEVPVSMNDEEVNDESGAEGVEEADKADEPGGGDQVGDSEQLPVKPKKDFRFSKSIDELYDEKSSEEEDINTNDKGSKKAAKKKPKKRGRLMAVLYTVLVVAIAGVLAAFALSCFIDMSAIGKADRAINGVTIPKSASVAQIADTLKKDGVIDNNIAFRLYVKFKHESGFQYSDMSYDDIITELRKPAAQRVEVKVTIPEGKTLQQIDQILTAKNVCTQGEFIAAVEKGGFKFTYDSQVPNNKNRFYKYEGYLFPDTYDFYVGSTGKEAAQKFFDNFDVKFTPAMQARAQAIGMTVDQVITLASIIQAEAGPAQMADVSSVFHNRLANGLKDDGGKKFLQSDATIFYATKDIQPVLAQASTEYASAYNTYKHEGLPPGPICNPGMDAINAALNPANTTYYYFVTDNNGDYLYASTYTQHAKNVQRALQTNEARGTDVYK